MNAQTLASSLLAGLILAGCSHTVTDPFADDAGFQKTTLADGGVFAIKSANALRGYNAVYLESVVAEPAPGMAGLEAEQSDVTALEYAFENSFKTTLSSGFTIADGPGEHTLLAVATIDNVVFSDGGDAGGGATTENAILDQDLVDADDPDGGYLGWDGMPVINNTNLGVGDVTLRLQLRDSVTGVLLASFHDETFGGTVEAISGETSWSRVADAFNRWGNELEQQLLSATGR